MSAVLMFIAVVLYVLGLLFFTLKRIVFRGKWEFVVYFMLLYLPFYISILSIAYQATGSDVVVAFFQYLKELILALAVLAFVLYQKDPFGYGFKLNIIDWLFMVFFSLATVYLFLPLGEATFVNKLLYLKNTLLIGAFYFLGRNTVFDAGQIKRVFSIIMGIAIAACCLNIFEKTVGVHFQNMTGYALFNYAINGVEPSGNYGLSWTFETQTTGMRLASFFSDPLELASSCLLAFSTGLIWYLSTKREEGGFYMLVMVAAVGSLFFSASRAAFGAFFLMVFFIAVVFRLYRLLLLGLGLLATFVIYVVYFASDDFYYFVYDTITFQNASSVGHVIEWLLALDTMLANPEGIGLAMSGNTGSVEDEVRVGGENQFLIYGVQLGVMGMLLYITILFLGIFKSMKVFRASEDVNLARMAFVTGATKFGLLLPLFTANAELYAYVSLTTWWMMGYTMTGYNRLFLSRNSTLATT
ncbi:O-antigen ligase domain-containing protein [Negadavirga shengliensis]|uniref:O-antigen ligase domain-containing protein n=1 Tax=Negadavirga shengliensis TaxID=1389218 RepID=A0ABV9SXJ6_9BACT